MKLSADQSRLVTRGRFLPQQNIKSKDLTPPFTHSGPLMPSAFPNTVFSADTFKVSSTCYLFAPRLLHPYASISLLPRRLQGWIPGPWLAVTWAGFSPARFRDIAKPQLMGDPSGSLFCGSNAYPSTC